MDGADHYQRAMDLLAMSADPDVEESDRVEEFLVAANVHMTAAMIHAVNPELARQWAQP